MKLRKVRAFTILEVTVTMLITAVVIAITFTSFSVILKYYHSVNKKNSDVMELASLDHLLRRDFDRADTIFTSAQGITINEGGKSIIYIFDPAFVIRKAAAIDTFKLQTGDLWTGFENIQIKPVNIEQEDNLIDELSFSISCNQEEIPYHYKKNYSSQNLFNRDHYAIY